MDTTLIKNRRHEVEAQIERLEARVTELRNELADLDTAERVLARLTGASGGEARAADEPKPASFAGGGQASEPPLTEKINTVLAEAHRRGLKGLEPAGIYDAIIAKGWAATKDGVRTTTWRLWNEKRLDKIAGTSSYSILGNEKPAGETSAKDTPTGLFNQPEQQGREAGPGGGT